jgi:hypothetical protein
MLHYIWILVLLFLFLILDFRLFILVDLDFFSGVRRTTLL